MLKVRDHLNRQNLTIFQMDGPRVIWCTCGQRTVRYRYLAISHYPAASSWGAGAIDTVMSLLPQVPSWQARPQIL